MVQEHSLSIRTSVLILNNVGPKVSDPLLGV